MSGNFRKMKTRPAWRAVLIGVLASWLVPVQVYADEQSSHPQLDVARFVPATFMGVVLSPQLNTDGKWAHDQFEFIDPDGDGITRAEIDKLTAKLLMQSKRIQADNIGLIDADGDGAVRLAEVNETVLSRRWGAPLNFLTRHAASLLYKKMLDNRAGIFAKADTDADGSLTPAEIDGFLDTQDLIRHWHGKYPLLAFAMDLDLDRDGTVTRREYQRVLDAITPEAQRRRAETEQQERAEKKLFARFETCKVAEASPLDRVILAGVYEGSAYADVSAAGPDYDTKAGEIHVAPGSDPLYLIMTNYKGTVWRIYGAVERVSHIVLANAATGKGSANASAVMGIEKSKVSFVSSWDCVYPFTDLTDRGAANAQKMVERLIGRKPDTIVAMYSVGAIMLPAGQTQEATVRFKPKLEDTEERMGFRLPSHGLMSIDPENVVSAGTFEKLPVLPAEFGILQLVQEGKLEPVQIKEFTYRPTGFLVKEALRVPPGSMPRYFLLPDGMPEPQGDMSRTCLLSANSREPLPHQKGFCP